MELYGREEYHRKLKSICSKFDIFTYYYSKQSLFKSKSCLNRTGNKDYSKTTTTPNTTTQNPNLYQNLTVFLRSSLTTYQLTFKPIRAVYRGYTQKNLIEGSSSGLVPKAFSLLSFGWMIEKIVVYRQG